MSNFFELAESEINCSEKEIAYNFSLLDFSFFNESSESEQNDGIITRICKAIDNIIKTLKDRISEFFANKSTTDALNSVEAASIKDPSIKQKKIKMTDYRKVDKLHDDTVKKLDKCNSSKEVGEVMDKYRKERRTALLFMGTTTVMIAVGFLTRKKYKEKIAALEKQADVQKKAIRGLKAGNRNLRAKSNDQRKENLKLKQENAILRENDPAKKVVMQTKYASENVQRANTKFNGTMEGVKKIASAKTEVLSNAAKDCLSEVKETAQNVAKSTGTVGKGIAVAKGVKNIGDVVVKTANGTNEKSSKNAKASQMREELTRMHSSISKAKDVMEKSKKGSPEYNRAKAYVSKYIPIYDKKKYAYSTFVGAKK